jgi:hypothetical protein
MPEPVPIHRLKLLRLLRRVDAALSAWDELDAMALLPPSLRGCEPLHSARRAAGLYCRA